ncbi:class I SAM-dependent methyltransferase [Amycolatopsis methanolica]|uniref:S-adenosyl-L-methionine-dependent methyltransferase n=1 Tax=Amycolatopsis methanolica 239 TaxID=1068978 RepID=A0A076MKH8_AMYME|nr:SAM-dependent methyltransferase [Amycolatopsis methanolica]AIJ21358.1 methyltransferase [Amycolatopsis methanolica 239]
MPASRTALTAAAARAAHLHVDSEPLLFRDTLAERLLGEHATELLGYHLAHGDHPVLAGARVQTTLRSRIAEDRLHASGLRQYVVLGAGLDTFAQRDGRVRTFEVDHPASQSAKRELLAAAGIPEAATHVPLDLAKADLDLTPHGLAPEPAFVSWLGVLMYLDATALDATLTALARLAAGSELVADYLLPSHLRDEAGNTYVEAVGAMTAGRGEPWRTFLDPDEIRALLLKHGFDVVEDLGQHDFLAGRVDSLRPAHLSRVVRAVRSGR